MQVTGWGTFMMGRVRSAAVLLAFPLAIATQAPPQDLRDQDSLRQHVATQMNQVQQLLEALIVDRPRRQIIRSGPARNGGSHAARD